MDAPVMSYNDGCDGGPVWPDDPRPNGLNSPQRRLQPGTVVA